MAGMFQDMADFAPDEEDLRAVGSLFQSLVTGVMAQWLVDPDRAPTGQQLATALRVMLAWQRGAADSTEVPAAGSR
jgi:hypothetical protein